MKNRIELTRILDFIKSEGIEFEYFGKDNIVIDSACAIGEVTDGVICWISFKKYATYEIVERLRNCKNVVLVSSFAIEGVNCLVTKESRRAFFSVINEFFTVEVPHSISDRAVVLTKNIGKNVHIGPNCYIGEDVTIGDNTIIHPNVSIVCPCSIGHDCELFPGVVIGAEGFGHYMNNGVPYREKHKKGVIIGNYVEIGSNACIDRGLLINTIIGDHVKINNLCHIGHNTLIEENCKLYAGSIVCGSVIIKKGAYIAPGATVIDHVTVGEGAKVGSSSLAIRDVKPNTTILGVPGKRIALE